MQPTDTRLPQTVGARMVETPCIRSNGSYIATIKWIVGIVGPLILCASCLQVNVSTHLSAPQLKEFSENLEKWEAHGITNYQMRFEWNCFCGDAGRSVLVEVRNGLVHSAVFEDDGTPVSVDSIHSIDSLFASIKGRLDFISAEYNAEYGYPQFAVFDSDWATDFYVDYKVELLVIMEEDTNIPGHE
ncbi:MAG: DUF6174 domain-containing protein [Gammaproteobacteria bacterium]|nr:DUF6174 domain-containing protein [Gammaproteobacteria bacterium]